MRDTGTGGVFASVGASAINCFNVQTYERKERRQKHAKTKRTASDNNPPPSQKTLKADKGEKSDGRPARPRLGRKKHSREEMRKANSPALGARPWALASKDKIGTVRSPRDNGTTTGKVSALARANQTHQQKGSSDTGGHMKLKVTDQLIRNQKLKEYAAGQKEGGRNLVIVSCKNSKGEEESVFVVRPAICQKNVKLGLFGEKPVPKELGERSNTHLLHRTSHGSMSDAKPGHQHSRAFVSVTAEQPLKAAPAANVYQSTVFLNDLQFAARIDRDATKD